MALQARWGQVIDAVVEQCRALPGYRGPESTDSGTTVWDGPEFQASEDHAQGEHLIIGWPGNIDATTPAANSTWTTGPIASTVRPRDETTTIACVAIAQHGSTPKESRDLANTVLADVATLLRTNPSLNIDASATIGGVLIIAYVTAGTMSQYLGPSGYTTTIEFTLTYSGRV
jgi:hypothetical protein